jgi:hypothetical protein
MLKIRALLVVFFCIGSVSERGEGSLIFIYGVKKQEFNVCQTAQGKSNGR